MTLRRFVNGLSGAAFDNDDLIRVRVKLSQAIFSKRLAVEDNDAKGDPRNTHLPAPQYSDSRMSPRSKT